MNCKLYQLIYFEAIVFPDSYLSYVTTISGTTNSAIIDVVYKFVWIMHDFRIPNQRLRICREIYDRHTTRFIS